MGEDKKADVTVGVPAREGIKGSGAWTEVDEGAAYAQALIDQADAEVRRIARKAGVPGHAMDRAMRDFARELVPHAGRQASVHSPRHWRQWWRGYVAGLNAAGGQSFVPTHQMMVEDQETPQEALHFLVQAIEGDMTKPSQFRVVLGQVPSGTWAANAEWVEP
jgi:FAD/FMN-containing dehydrogenase